MIQETFPKEELEAKFEAVIQIIVAYDTFVGDKPLHHFLTTAEDRLAIRCLTLNSFDRVASAKDVEGAKHEFMRTFALGVVLGAYLYKLGRIDMEGKTLNENEVVSP